MRPSHSIPTATARSPPGRAARGQSNTRCASSAGRRRRWLGKDGRMDRDYEHQTHEAEDRHWWYRGRRTVLDGVIASLGLPEHARILDAGCGSGRNMVELRRVGTVTGMELSHASVVLA